MQGIKLAKNIGFCLGFKYSRENFEKRPSNALDNLKDSTTHILAFPDTPFNNLNTAKKKRLQLNNTAQIYSSVRSVRFCRNPSLREVDVFNSVCV